MIDAADQTDSAGALRCHPPFATIPATDNPAGSAASLPAGCIGRSSSPAYVTEFLALSDGVALTKAFTLIKEPELRRRIVRVVEEIAGDDET